MNPLSPDTPLDPDFEEFRRNGHAVIDEVVRYFQEIRDYPVLADVKPGEVARNLRRPEGEAGISELLDHYRATILPGVTHWNHPRFFAYFAITGSQAGILGELLSAALNVNGMLWRTSPSATEVEEQTLRWLGELLGLPPWFGIINDTASINIFLALAAAREATGLDIRTRGMAGRDLPPMRIYCSDQAHSSVDKAAIALGFGLDGLRRVSSDRELRLDPVRLREEITRDVAAGILPMAVIATLGTTSTAAVDPLEEVAAVAEQHGMWVHVDAAYGGAAAILEEYRWIWRGLERVDSLVVNPHKWLFTPIDCSVLYTRKPELLRQTFSLIPEYLKTTDEGVTNYMDFGLQLGRRFRALKLWLVLSYYGAERLRARVGDHIRYAERLASELESLRGIEIAAPQSMSVVAFRRIVRVDGETDEAASELETQELHDHINASGRCFVSHTRLRDQLVIRVAIGNGATVWSDVEVLLDLVREFGDR
jgi:aromatic-L-amino-acid/L-tryptophan decarboxylase